MLTYFLIPARTDHSLAGKPNRRTPETPDWRADLRLPQRLRGISRVYLDIASFVEDCGLQLRRQTAQNSLDAVGEALKLVPQPSTHCTCLSPVERRSSAITSTALQLYSAEILTFSLRTQDGLGTNQPPKLWKSLTE